MDAITGIITTVLSFVAVLSVVVFVHELGHFQAARWLGIAVDTFSIGFGKSLAEWRSRAGIRWKIGALPLGGYVKFADDADGVSMGPKESLTPEEKAEARRKGMFHAQPVWKRAIVVAAGPMSNFIFSIAVFAAVSMMLGRDTTDVASLPARVVVMEDSAAAEAGLRNGDVILQVNGREMPNWGTFQQTVAASQGEPLELLVRSGDETRTLTVTPRATRMLERSGATVERFVIGVGSNVLPNERTIETVGPVEAVGMGAQLTWGLISQTVTYLSEMITGANAGREISGPLGILSASGQVAESALSADHAGPLDAAGALLMSLLQWAAILSVAVGFVNLLPIPILDGGHLLFYAIEAVRGGKPLPAVAQEWAFRAGLAVMASLFLFATWNDVTRQLAALG